MEIPKWLKRDEEAAKEHGGADLEDYTSPDGVRYCDKGGHKERSIANSEQHRKHWNNADDQSSPYNND